jgi:hypothetical protein
MGTNACSDSNPDSAHLVVDRLHFPRVNADADFDAKRGATASTIFVPHLTALAGPSNVAKNPSPAVSISTPR